MTLQHQEDDLRLVKGLQIRYRSWCTQDRWRNDCSCCRTVDVEEEMRVYRPGFFFGHLADLKTATNGKERTQRCLSRLAFI